MKFPCYIQQLICALCIALPAAAQSSNEMEKLKAQLADQQVQLDQLRSVLEQQKKLIDGMFHANANDPAKPKSLGEVASLTPMAPLGMPEPKAMPTVMNDLAQKAPEIDAPSPLALRIGNSYLTPVGFMDFTSVTRSTVGGGGIGSNFGSIPYNTAATAHLSESRLSTQNSRIGMRFDSMFKDMKILGYFEGDFLGNNGGNVAVSSNSDTFRLRLYYVDLQKGKFEVMAGESWSLLTPGRSGISPLPGNIFYSQDIDVNYQAGLVWTRDPQLRFVYHASDKLAMAVSLENAEQYVGGSAGGSTIVPPSGLASTVFTQFNNGTQTLGTPNLHPDIIAKIAWDPTKRFHGEVAGVERTFKSYNQLTDQHYTKAAGGVSANLGFDLYKGLRAVTNDYYSSGGGRYIFGQAPDLVLKGNGDIGLLHSSSTVSGLEETIDNVLLYAYYGGIYIDRYTVIDPATGKPAGYGYAGSSNSQNKTIQEATLGFNQTLWKDARYGALNLMGQYSYLMRNPWSVAAGTPKSTHQNQVYINLRYTLPGSAPTLK